jgi:hypothetical protein
VTSEPQTSYVLAAGDEPWPHPLAVGWLAKLMFVPSPGRGMPEAMWLAVTDINGPPGHEYAGTLDSVPGLGKGLPMYGDPVQFGAQHVIAVMDSDGYPVRP